MALRVTISLSDDVAAELQRSASRTGRSLEEEVTASLRSSTHSRVKSKSKRSFEIRAKALHARPGVNLDDIGELLDQAEGPTHR